MNRRFLVDEDISRLTTRMLRDMGYSVEDVRDIGLRGHSDQEVFLYAQKQKAILLTADKGFANTIRFPVGSHAGIMVMRVPAELPTSIINRELSKALHELAGEDLVGTLVIIELGRIRIRRPTFTDS